MAAVFLALSLLYGMLFIFLTPPFQAPDEPAHFFRAYAISEGSLRMRTHGGLLGQPLPRSLPAFATELTVRLAGDQREHTSAAEILRSLRYRFASDQRVLALVPIVKSGPVAYTAGGTPPFMHLPASAVLAAGRLLDLPVLTTFYLCRFMNLLISVLLVYAAIRITPFGKTIIAAIGLMPMAVFLRSSLLPDSILISLALLSFSLVIRETTAGRFRPRQVGILLLVLFLVAVTKPLYLLMPALALLTQSSARQTLGLYFGAFLATVLAATVIGFWVFAPIPESAAARPLDKWTAAPASSESGAGDLKQRLSIQEQANSIARDPAGFLLLAAREYRARSAFLAKEFVGRFGWLDTGMPSTVSTIYIAFLLLLAITDGRPDLPLAYWQRAILVGVFAGTLLTIAACLYVAWTPVGANHIEGMQGRYFIPVAPALFFATTNRRFSTAVSARGRAIMLAVIVSVSMIFAIWSMVARFYGSVPSPLNYMAMGERPTPQRAGSQTSFRRDRCLAFQQSDGSRSHAAAFVPVY